MIRRILFASVAATMALIFSVVIVAALLWGKRAVVWQVCRSEREQWQHQLIQWRASMMGP